MAYMKSVIFKGKKITASKVRKTCDWFDKERRGKIGDSGTGYVVNWRGRRYPPKLILAMASGISRRSFSGGDTTNAVFRELGFKVLEDIESKRLDDVCPRCPELVDQMFKRRWARFLTNEKESSLKDGEYPGVYILAFSGIDLNGRRIREANVFYVGMSCIAIRKRLRQFRAGLQDGGHHSGARHFYHDWNGGKPFDEANSDKNFYVATISIPCRYKKIERVSLDLQKLGTVTALEYFVLARIKQKTGKEPDLNWK